MECNISRASFTLNYVATVRVYSSDHNYYAKYQLVNN